AKTASSSSGDEDSVRNFVPPPGTVRKPACPARCLSGFCGLKWNAYTSAVRCTSRTSLSSVDVNICRFGIFIQFSCLWQTGAAAPPPGGGLGGRVQYGGRGAGGGWAGQQPYRHVRQPHRQRRGTLGGAADRHYRRVLAARAGRGRSHSRGPG